MTDGAVIGSLQMINIHSRTDHTIVTRCTAVNNTGMIIYTGNKSTWGMTSATIFSGWHVIEGLSVGGRIGIIIVTGRARLYLEVDDRVIENTFLRESLDHVAQTAIGSGCWMACRFTNGVDAIMTDGTITRDSAVIENSVLKIINDVTQTAVNPGRQMAIIFTRSHYAVVACIAMSADIRMIKTTVSFQRDKTGRIVTVIALDCRLDVMV